MAKEFRLKRCTDHPGKKGSLDCAECAAKLRGINTAIATSVESPASARHEGGSGE